MIQLKSSKDSSFYRIRLLIERILNIFPGFFLFQYQRRDNLFNYFYNILKYQHVDNPSSSPKFNYYEFGVASGGSMKIYILALQKFCRDFKKDINRFYIFGFDSFAGLPEATEADKRLDWKSGLMNHPETEVKKMLKEVGFPMKNARLIRGFFEESLTPELKRELSDHPPALVNMDADYYSSTILVLNWLGEFLPSGSFFRFDDIWSFYGHPEKGVVKAINEFNTLTYGYLTPCPIFGLASYSYVFSKREFEYV